MNQRLGYRGITSENQKMARALMLVVSCVFAVNCGGRKAPTLQAEHRDILVQGKRFHHSGSAHGRIAGLNLANGEIHSVSEDPYSQTTQNIVFDTSKTTALKSEETLNFSQSVLTNFAKELGIEAQEWQLSGQAQIRNQRYLHTYFERWYQGFEVRDAFLEVIFVQRGDLWHLSEVFHHGFGDIDELSGDPEFDAEDFATRYPGAVVEFSKQLIYPVYDEESGAYRFHLATQFDLNMDKGTRSFTLTHDGRSLLEGYSHQNSINARLLGEGLQNGYLDGSKRQIPLQLTKVNQGQLELETDAEGRIEGLEAGAVEILLSSERAQLFDNGSQRLVSLPLDVTEGDNLLVPSASQLPALNAYTSVLRVNAFARQYLTEDQLSFLRRPITIIVDVPGDCNAFYDTRLNSINLFSDGSGCADMSLVNEVVYHEWGHGLDFFTGRRGGITDGAFSEGLSDIVAMLMTDSSVIAEGFRQNRSSGIRDLDNNRRFPDDRGAVHSEGLIIGGAFYDLMTAMKVRYGAAEGIHRTARLFFQHLLTADSYLESYAAVLRLNDDDANGATRSPDHCIINSAFAAHGLAENDSCVDDFDAELIPAVNQQLNLALREENDQGLLQLMASLPDSEQGVETIDICLKPVNVCVTSPEFAVASMKLEGRSGDRLIFTHQQFLDLNLLDEITLVPRNAEGNATSYRMHKLISR